MSYALLSLAAIEFVALIWAFRQWLNAPKNYALLLSLTILFPVSFDALTNGIGGNLGEGDLLELLIRFRLTWFYFSMPFLIPIAVLLMNYADIGWSRAKGVTFGAFLLAVAVGSYQIYAYRDMPLYPSCVFDVVRYVLSVPMDQACRPGEAGLGDPALSPVVPISAMFLLLTSIVLVWKTRFNWVLVLLLASNMALVIVVQIPREGYLTFISYPFDGLLAFMLTLTSVHLYGNRDTSMN